MNESMLQEQICEYLKRQYPGVEYRNDLGGIRLTLGQARRVARSQKSRAWPDLFIAAARGGKYGLFIELKKDGTTIYKRNGEMVKDEHIREQAVMLEKLRGAGYAAEFGIGLYPTIEIIDRYLRG